MYVAHRNTASSAGGGSTVFVYDAGNGYQQIGSVAGFSRSVSDVPNAMAALPDGTRLYVGSVGYPTIQVIDVPSNEVVATIANLFPNQLAINASGTRLYSSGGTNCNGFHAIDTGTNSVIGGFGACAGGLAVDQTTETIYVVDSTSQNQVDIVDPTTLSIIGTIPLPGRGFLAALTPDGKSLYVTSLTAPPTTWAIDTRARAIVTTLSGIDGAYPFDGLVASRDGSSIYEATGSSIQIISTTTNQVSGSIPVSAQSLSLSADGRSLIAASYNGGVWVIDTGTNAVVQTLSDANTPSSAMLLNPPPVGVNLDLGLVGYWNFDEGSGATAFDASGYGDNGGVSNVPGAVFPTWSNDVPPTAYPNAHSLVFNGSSTEVDLGNPPQLQITGNLSLSLWFKTTAPVGNYNTLLGKWWSGGQDAAYELAFYTASGGGLLFFALNNSTFTAGASAVDNVARNDGFWHHAVGAWDGTNAQYYLDGSLIQSNAFSSFGPIANISHNLKVGADDRYSPGTGDRFFNGLIDDVRVYKRALSSCEVAVLASSDHVAPATAATISPAANSAGWSNAFPAVTLSASDSGGSCVRQLTYSASGAAPIARSVVPGPLVSFNVKAEGQTTVSYFATDNALNREAQKTLSVRVDVTPPTASLDATHLPAYTNQSSIVVNGSATDTGSGIASALVRVTAPNGTIASYPLSSGSATVPLSTDGSYVLSVVATDVAGNVAASQAATVVRDTVPPAISGTPPNGAAYGAQNISFSYALTDAIQTGGGLTLNGSAVPACNLSSAGSAQPVTEACTLGLVSGNNTVVISASDAAGNTASTSLTLLYDASAPVPTLADGNNNPFPAAPAYGPLAGDALSFTLTVSDLGATTTSPCFASSCALPRGGGVIHGSMPLVEARQTFNFVVTNEVGKSTTVPFTVTYDKTPPAGSITAPAAGAFTRGTIHFSASASDNLTGVASVSFQVDALPPIQGSTTDGSSFSASFNTTQTNDGTHTLRATMIDGVGNSAALNEAFVVDNTPPAVAINSPAAGAFLHQTISISATGSDATSGVASVTILMNGNGVGSCAAPAGPCVVSFDTTTLPDGTFSISASALDNAGNASALAQITATSVNNAPKNFIASPAAGQVLTTSMNVSVNVTDPYFASIQCSVDGVSLGSSTSPTFSQTVSLTSKMDGVTTVSCSATDKAGNVGTQSVNATIKNWTERMRPRHLNLRSRGNSVRMLVRNIDPRVANASSVLLPIAGKNLGLSVPCVAPVPALGAMSPGVHDDDDDGDSDNDADDVQLSRVLIKFSRQQLINAINGSIHAGCTDPRKPMVVTLVSGSHIIGSDTITIRP